MQKSNGYNLYTTVFYPTTSPYPPLPEPTQRMYSQTNFYIFFGILEFVYELKLREKPRESVAFFVAIIFPLSVLYIKPILSQSAGIFGEGDEGIANRANEDSHLL